MGQVLTPKTHPMDFRSRIVLILATLFLSCALVFGCVSMRFFMGVEGGEVVPPGEQLQAGKTTLEQALLLLGAPDKLTELEGKDLLVYERTVVRQNELSFGIPVLDVLGGHLDLSARGGLASYDTLVLFFTPDGILNDMVFEQGSSAPYLKTLLQDQ